MVSIETLREGLPLQDFFLAELVTVSEITY